MKSLSLLARTAAVLALLVGAFIVWLVFASETPTAPKSAPSGTPVSSPSDGAWLSPFLGTTEKSELNGRLPGVASGPVAASKPDLASEFENAANLRAFYESALQRPAHGGVFYARAAASYCTTVMDWVSAHGHTLPPVANEAGTQAALRAQRLTTLQARCQAFSPAELGSEGLRKIRADPRSKDDPLERAALVWLSPAARGVDHASASAQVLSTQDPSLFAASNLGIHSNGIYFGGELYAFNSTSGFGAEVPTYARKLAACGLGLSCDGSNLEVQLACVFEGVCVSSMGDLARVQLERQLGAEAGAAAFEKAVSLAPRMASAFRSQEVHAFLPPQK